MGEQATVGTGERQIGGSTTGALVGYVRRVCGEEGIEALLALAGDDRPTERLTDTTMWSSYGQAVALFQAAAEVTGDPEVGRRVGEELLLQYAGTEVAALLRSLGSPAEVLRNVAATAAKFSTVTAMEAVEVSDGRVLISARTSMGIARDRHLCLYTEGVLAQATPLFGLPRASVVELECQTRGDAQCLYRVSWDPDASVDDDLERKCAHLESELKSLTTRFESLQATATELVTADTVDDVLASVARRAGLAVRAPRHLLAVRLTADGPVRVHHNGFSSPTEARAAADELLDESGAASSESRLVVDIATVRTHFGRIAALYPGGSRFFVEERRLLEAYAGHVAAALEAAAALENARRKGQTARALLGLGRALAGLGTPENVASRLAAAMSEVVDCDQQGVFLWDEERKVLELAASAGVTEEVKAIFEDVQISAADTAFLAQMLREPAPLFLTIDTADDYIAALLRRSGASSVAVVPINTGEQFFGVVTAAFKDGDRCQRGDVDLLERLSGLADHAATALQNSHLLKQVQAQALHDPLTGLPNARLLEDRMSSAITSARRDGTSVAVLFLDLDHFKPVNDRYGHAVGDAVLIEAARRMRSELRAGDTVARLAGDEFVILLPGLTETGDADAVAEKISRVLQQSFDVAGHHVRISGSVGIAVFPDSGEEYGTLLRQADAAMYRAKAQRPVSYAHATDR